MRPTPIITSESPGLQASWTSATQGAAPVFVALAVLLITFTYMMAITESLTASLDASYERSLDDAAESAREGVWTRQVAFATLGLLGLAAAWWSGGRRLGVYDSLSILCLAYVVWCVASCLWATDPAVSVRGLVAVACEVFAGIALARHASPRQLVWITFACTLSWLGLGIACELTLGTFRPGAAEYRFAGVFHPNDMGVVCALLILSSMYLIRCAPRRKWLLRVIAAVGLAFLYLTGSRTALGCMILVAATGWIISAPQPRVLVGLLAGIWMAAVVGLLFQSQLADRAAGAASLGRVDGDVASFTGRVPLWNELLPYIAQRPWMGYGYNSFWTADHILELTGPEWGSVTNGHSLYVNSVLNIGFIGAALCIAGILSALVRAIRLERRFPTAGYGFMALLLTYTLISGVAETTMGITKFLPCVTLCAICFLAFRDNEALELAQATDEPPQVVEPPRVRHGLATT